MPSTQLTLAGATLVLFTLDRATTRVDITQLSTPGSVFVTTDGSTPVVPANGVLNPVNQVNLGGVVGAPVTVTVPQPGDHMVVPTLRFVGSANSVISLSW
jgi:hypothetical protein